MQGAVSRLSLLLVVSLALHPVCRGQNGPPTEALAIALVEAKTEGERQRLLETNSELVTVQLRKLLITQGQRLVSQASYSQAHAIFELTYSIAQRIGDKGGMGSALLSDGIVYDKQSNYGLAVKYFHKSLALFEETGDKAGIASSWNNIGLSLLSQGNYEVAGDYFGKSFRTCELLENKICIAQTLTNLGIVNARLGNFDVALGYFKRVLEQSEAAGYKNGIASMLHNLGQLNFDRGDYDQSADYFKKALVLRVSLGDREGEALSLIGLGELYYKLGDYGQALESAESAARIAREIGSRSKLWHACTIAGKTYRAMQQPAQARIVLDEAITAVESLRTEIAGGEQTQQRFFENKISPYLQAVGLLVSQNKPAEALAYAERAKARVLLDVLRAGRTEITKAMTPKEQDEEQRLLANIATINAEAFRSGHSPARDQARLADLEKRLHKARVQYEAFQATLYAAHPELKIRRGEVQPATLLDATELLPDSDSALIEYVVTNEVTYLFVVSRNRANNQGLADLKVYTLPIPREQLTEHAKTFREQLGKRDLTFGKAARTLFDALIEPAQSELRAKRTLIIVPDGPLWELPFQALQNSGGRYLIEDYALSYAPSLTVLREMSKLRKRNVDAPSTTLLAIGNPRIVKATAERLERERRDKKAGQLPEAEREVKTLAHLYGNAQTRMYIGAEAREDRVKAEAGSFGVLHLATHGILNDASPMYSQIVLAQSDESATEDGLLEAWEIMKLDLKARLVVLSGCETGRGRIGAGEGMIGLTWAFFVAGSPTTVVSQWKVESASTSKLMVEFHRNLRTNTNKTQFSTAEALQRAAVKLLRSKDFVHPFYWAGFILVGDGR